jgi:hypothetical protein
MCSCFMSRLIWLIMVYFCSIYYLTSNVYFCFIMHNLKWIYFLHCDSRSAWNKQKKGATICLQVGVDNGHLINNIIAASWDTLTGVMNPSSVIVGIMLDFYPQNIHFCTIIKIIYFCSIGMHAQQINLHNLKFFLILSIFSTRFPLLYTCSSIYIIIFSVYG